MGSDVSRSRTPAPYLQRRQRLRSSSLRHYAALRAGLDSRDPSMLAALASLGPFDVVVNGAADADSAWARYVSGAPGAVHVGGDSHRTDVAGFGTPGARAGSMMNNPSRHVLKAARRGRARAIACNHPTNGRATGWNGNRFWIRVSRLQICI
jgi:hypothetical protein